MKRWTEEEAKRFQTLYPILSKKQVKDCFPDRTLDAIHSRARWLHLTKHISRWSKEETKKLRLLYPTLSNEQLKSHFPNRSYESIHGRIVYLQLKRPSNFYDHSPPSISETEKAYIAGLFDGEGTVCVGTDKIHLHHLRLSICNTNREVIEWLYHLFGGSIHTPIKGKSHWKTSYVWNASPRRAKMFLELIEPFAIIKKKQIRISIKFQNTFNYEYNHSLGPPKKLLAKREKYKKEIRRLNSTSGN